MGHDRNKNEDENEDEDVEGKKKKKTAIEFIVMLCKSLILQQHESGAEK